MYVRGSITCIQFAHDASAFAIGVDNRVEVWNTPGLQNHEYSPFIKMSTFRGHEAAILSVTWRRDSRSLYTSSSDSSVRLWTLQSASEKSLRQVLSGHRDSVIACFVCSTDGSLYTVSVDGAIYQWMPDVTDENKPTDHNSTYNDRFVLTNRYYLMQTGAVTCAAFHDASSLLCVGLNTGTYQLFHLPDFEKLQHISLSHTPISSVEFSHKGDWIALSSMQTGLIMIWEWKAESYILKQQNFAHTMRSMAFTYDGERIVTAGDDGTMKIWDMSSGFCIATFNDHKSVISAVAISPQKRNVAFTASMDGTVRAWDLVRLRNFKTFTTAEKDQLSSLAVNAGGDVVAAGSSTTFDIFVWNVQTGQLLEALSGHEAPIVSLKFTGGTTEALCSASWDKTLRTWDLFERSKAKEIYRLRSDAQAIACRPDGRQICCATMDGSLTFLVPNGFEVVTVIDGKRDIRTEYIDARSNVATQFDKSKFFSSIVYTSDGTCIIAGGPHATLCMYDVTSGYLLRRWTTAPNMVKSGYWNKLKPVDSSGDRMFSLLKGKEHLSMADSLTSDRDLSKISDGPSKILTTDTRTRSLAYSPTDRNFAVLTVSGILIFSLDTEISFNPFELDADINPETILAALASSQYAKAFVMAIRLNQDAITRHVYESIPAANILLVVRDVPLQLIEPVLTWLAGALENTPHIELHLLWVSALFSVHGRNIKGAARIFSDKLRMYTRALAQVNNDMITLGDDISYQAKFLLQRSCH